MPHSSHASTLPDTRPALSGGGSRRGFTLWLTGLSGAGKSTVAAAVAERLRAERAGRAQDKDDGGGLETLRRDGYM